jgi:hypothetical protein
MSNNSSTFPRKVFLELLIFCSIFKTKNTEENDGRSKLNYDIL